MPPYTVAKAEASHLRLKYLVAWIDDIVDDVVAKAEASHLRLKF